MTDTETTAMTTKDGRTKILLVDDKRENLLALSSLIDAPDVEVLTATSGDDALALVLEHHIALALLDVQMPGMNGFELARLMRSGGRSRNVPIIFVTASQSAREQIFEGYDRGAVDYLLKPLDPVIVRSKVRVFVELDQKTKALRSQGEALAGKLAEVEALREAAEAANRAKSRFLANMSHEIRTPLGAVLGYTELLRANDGNPDERASNLDAITRNGQLLLKLIDDVLDLAKIEAERVETERAPVDLHDLLEDLKAVHSHRASEKGIALDIVPTGLLPRTIQSDALRLKQILNNLIGNAIKFTSKGAVVVRVVYEPEVRTAQLKFVIKDDGVGLTAAEAGRLFQPFTQADSSTRRRFGGTGLGLVISKQLSQLLGGDVILSESAPGKGSTFIVRIDPGPIDLEQLVPSAAIASAAPAPAHVQQGATAAIRLDGLRVLVVDDSADNRVLMTRLLKLAGATVDCASDGSEAIHKALTGHHDVVLMDIQMPETDGYEATACLRKRGFDRPIIALTAHAMREDLDRSLQAGCNHHLSKPVDRTSLLNLLARQRA